MKWIELTESNRPSGEVLAANFKSGSFGYREKLIGYIHFSKENQCFIASSEHEELENVSHFIHINSFDL